MPLFGMITFPTEYSMPPFEVARASEGRGLDAFYVSEHTHIPTSKKSKYPGETDYHKDFYCPYDPNRGADHGSQCNHAIPTRHLYLPDCAARSDRHCQAICHTRSPVGWPGGGRMRAGWNRKRWATMALHSHAGGPRFAST